MIPTTFYYKLERPTEPTTSFSLGSAPQWRHRTEAEAFEGLISFDLGRAEIAGAITCEVHAGNISVPVRSILPIRIRTRSITTEAVMRDLLRRLRWRCGS